MTAEQLQAARAAHWRQNQSPILTLDQAENWLEQHPLCLYLPRRAQLPAPAPSFVEACIGSTQATPGRDAIEQAQTLLARLIAQGSVVALNLLGGVSEQPDFLAARQALPYVLCLRADSDWKHAPQKSSGHKVSPLVLELWKALDSQGVLTASEAKETLGRELTEAAILRALCELWQGLRISPSFPEPDQPARWEMLRIRHRDALSTASATAQVTALSLLVSMYLQSVYAASSEEIEVFLSPVASRSRVREAVRGLSATRQIHSLSMDAQTYYFLEAGLPEFAPSAAPAAVKVDQPAPVTRTRVEPPRRPFPVQKPAPKKDLAARPVRRPSIPPPSRSRPEPRPAGQWKDRKGSGRPAAPAQKWAKPPAREARWQARDGASRPAPAAARSFPPTDGPRRGKPAREAGRGAPPGKRPAPWTGGKTRERPAPWARPGQGSASPPANAHGRTDSPYRPARKPRFSSPRGAAGGSGPAASRPSGSRPVAAGSQPPNRPSNRPPNRSWTPGRPSPATGRPSSPQRGGAARGGGRGSSANPGAGDKPGRPPFGPGSRPSRSWPRAGTAAGKPPGKPGKPSGPFRGRKPVRKKPGA